MVEWTGLKIEYNVTTDAHTWSLTIKEYARLCYLIHLARIRPSFPARKIRKCHMRKAIQRYRHEKKHAQRRYGL